jgi:hypothetical protein
MRDILPDQSYATVEEAAIHAIHGIAWPYPLD